MKEFICPKEGCESKQFILSIIRQTLVDFSQQGAVEGHPKLEHLSDSSGGFLCYECEERVPHDMAQEMAREVI